LGAEARSFTSALNLSKGTLRFLTGQLPQSWDFSPVLPFEGEANIVLIETRGTGYIGDQRLLGYCGHGTKVFG